MHIDYWGLDHSPFASQLDPSDYYPSAVHEEALARLDFLIANGRRLGFLFGASGTGKSLVLEVATRQLRRAGSHVIKINAVGLSANELIWKLANGLGHLVPPNANVVDCWSGISDRLIANRYQRMPTVIMVDDADEAGGDVHAALSRLALIDPHPDAQITIVLSAQRQRSAAFGSKLNDLCELRIDIEPWDLDESANYLNEMLSRVGVNDRIFMPDAVDLLFDLSHGVPRRLRQLAELSLLAGAAEELHQIPAAVVDSVYRGLTHVDSPAA
ncbi:MAG: AAA family ATPase [Planctomycetales bacterium]|nr:AAA family ATPase [Planctomycetales bacterium]